MVQVLLAPENAFGMLKLATMYSLPLLQWSSLRASLADFQSAVVADIIGFCSLEVSQLLELFADDHLQVRGSVIFHELHHETLTQSRKGVAGSS